MALEYSRTVADVGISFASAERYACAHDLTLAIQVISRSSNDAPSMDANRRVSNTDPVSNLSSSREHAGSTALNRINLCLAPRYPLESPWQVIPVQYLSLACPDRTQFSRTLASDRSVWVRWRLWLRTSASYCAWVAAAGCCGGFLAAFERPMLCRFLSVLCEGLWELGRGCRGVCDWCVVDLWKNSVSCAVLRPLGSMTDAYFVVFDAVFQQI